MLCRIVGCDENSFVDHFFAKPHIVRICLLNDNNCVHKTMEWHGQHRQLEHERRPMERGGLQQLVQHG